MLLMVFLLHVLFLVFHFSDLFTWYVWPLIYPSANFGVRCKSPIFEAFISVKALFLKP